MILSRLVGAPMEKPSKRSGLLHRSMDDEGLIFDPQTDTVHCLNQTAATIWELLDGSHDLGDIAKVITSKFRVDSARAILDVEKAVEDFRRLGLLLDR